MAAAAKTIQSVLLIDDDPDDFMVLEDALRQVDHSIRVSHIASIKDIPPQTELPLPDIIFLDVNMPERNGFEWLHCIREKGYNVPVINVFHGA